MKLTGNPSSYKVQRFLIAAAYAGVEVEVVEGKQLSLETKEGSITGAGAIARYGARLGAGLTGGESSFAQASVDQWVEFGEVTLGVPRDAWVLPVQKVIEFNGAAYGNSKKDMRAALLTLNEYLLNETFLVGNQVTLADIVVATALVDCYRLVFAPGYLRSFTNVTRWFTTCINQPQFKQVLGEVTFTTREQQAPKPKPAPKKEKKKVVQQQQPKKKPAKPKSLTASLPPSEMNLETVKKLFWSQKPFYSGFFDEFFGGIFDSEGFSFWIGAYQYNSDNTVYFMTQNLIGGWIQRLDPLRKYGMGAVAITGKDEETAPFNITSLWLFRGQIVPAEMMEAPSDACYYDWTKLDPTTCRAIVEEYWTSETINGQAILDRRFYK